MNQQAYQIDRDRRILVARPTRVECTGSDLALLVVELCRRIDLGEADSVVIELSNVQHMDSSCIGKLLSLRQHARSAGGSVALARCQPNVEFLFRMSHLEQILGLFDSTEAAVADLREQRNRYNTRQLNPEPKRLFTSRYRGHYAPLLAALLRAHHRKHAHMHQQDHGLHAG